MSSAANRQRFRETDGYGHLPRWTRAEVESHEQLEAVFSEWIEDRRGTIMWEIELRLARAIADTLDLTLVEGDDDA